MRLIDVDALKEYINDCEFCRHCPDKEFRCFLDCELPNCVTLRWRRVFDEQPTIERHGKWGKDYSSEAYSDDFIVCSECGNAFNVLDNDTYRFDYCPNCGARMDEDETDRR